LSFQKNSIEGLPMLPRGGKPSVSFEFNHGHARPLESILPLGDKGIDVIPCDHDKKSHSTQGEWEKEDEVVNAIHKEVNDEHGK
jgi:hypothetical protein